VKTLVVITGPPGSGKTTLAIPLARDLQLPLIAKDTIKEALFESLGTGDLAWSQRLGAATFKIMFAVAGAAPAAVLEAPFSARAVPDLLELCERPVEVHCRCPADEIIRRYGSRTRHPGHLDHQRLDSINAAASEAGPLGLGGPLLEVDTSSPVDVAEVANWIRNNVQSACELQPSHRSQPPTPWGPPPSEDSPTTHQRRTATRQSTNRAGRSAGQVPMWGCR
jgi:predicted kinase